MKGKRHLYVKLSISILGLAIFIFIIYSSTGSKGEIVHDSFHTNDLNKQAISEATDSASSGELQENVVVDVKGAVSKPGVYEIDSNARVHEVIDMAGGMTQSADPLSINLAERVYDEMTIVVLEEGAEIKQDGGGNVSNPRIKLNTATKEEIVNLPGIGPVKADAILQYRDEFGPFQQEEDLLNVSGIGEKTLEQLKEYIRVP
ncbi:helix-hairpin-helix domain-containing protein [Salirhabdus sp. Marseille-P4669]|uniref:helix-hairpin-helix domain-containing protein n=1 Tax=Salirhabdus sp. Marseille-P4669 TaxID=2042310 RepID=UPI000C7D8BF0|nr:helix-hairpin-helix domain-containing protein [Salirhabdus sp. Marseille-P4669]